MTTSEATDIIATAPREGDIKIYYYPQIGKAPAYEVVVPDFAAAVSTLNAVIGLSIFEFKHRLKPDYTDAAGIVRYESDGEGGYAWFEIDEDVLEPLGLTKP